MTNPDTKLTRETGLAAIIAMLMIVMLTLIGLATLSSSDTEVTISGNALQEMRAFYAAESGLEMAAAKLTDHYDSSIAPPANLPTGKESCNNCVYYFTVQDDGASKLSTLQQGSLAGLNALTKSFTVRSVGESSVENARVTLSQRFETSLVPIFQFAVFYDNDLEIAPGPFMTLNGRVHTNGDMYLQSGDGLDIDGFVTAYGDIYHGRKGPGGVSTADVRIKDAGGTYQSMQDGSGFLESTDSYWYDSSIARWKGRVQDASHGQQPLHVPLNGADSDPHRLIERGDSNPDSYEHKATLKFIDGTARAKVGGVWTDVTASLETSGAISFDNDLFYDGREQTHVDAMRLDMEKLYNSSYAPSNGVIYFSDQTSDFPALRVENASDLQAPLSIASENPIYTLGDFNSVDKKPAALMADAVTFLSGAWDDAQSTQSTSSRVPTPTTVNAAFLTGNTETTATDYNGGLENLPRFLEDWSGVRFQWRGSMINMWNSRQATGDWSGSYYSPPIRDWAYDTDFDDPSKLPPETPVVKVFRRTGWKQEYVGAIQDSTAGS